MIHHSAEDYDVAASKAAAEGRRQMEEIIHNGQVNAKATVDAILAKQIEDKIVKTPSVRVRFAEDEGVTKPYLMLMGQTDYEYNLHDHAYGQVLQDSGVPKRFADSLFEEGDWGRELVSQNVNRIFSHRGTQRNLVRAEHGLVKGWLSDKYRRLDSRPLLDAFMGAAGGLGLIPIDGIASDTRSRVRAVLPHVFEPVDNEVMIFGLEWGNSDYGNGGHVVNLWAMRVRCTNLAVTTSCLRQIHLGAKLTDDIQYSQRTYELDTKTNVSALKDVVKHAIGPAKVNGMLEAIRKTSETEIKGKDGIDNILKKHFDNKLDRERIAALYEGPDVQNLPPGNTLWRLSNAVSFFAQAQGMSADRKLEIQSAAGKLIPHKEDAAVAV